MVYYDREKEECFPQTTSEKVIESRAERYAHFGGLRLLLGRREQEGDTGSQAGEEGEGTEKATWRGAVVGGL
ncbi:hypothetical protein ACOMHN_032850 [Nucella lapillus]